MVTGRAHLAEGIRDAPGHHLVDGVEACADGAYRGLVGAGRHDGVAVYVHARAARPHHFRQAFDAIEMIARILADAVLAGKQQQAVASQRANEGAEVAAAGA